MPKIRILAVAYSFTIANLYYCQPLLPRMARSLGTSSALGSLTTLGQVGYAVGLILVVPLGDILRRRPLICGLLALDVVALLITATSDDVAAVLAAGVVIGLASASVVNILVPYAAGTVSDDERAGALATMLSAGMLGVLLSRSVAGVVASLLGWRALFLAAAAVTAGVAVVLARVLDPAPPELAIGYRSQLRAVARLALSEPVLRRRSLIGACVFATFGAFWATSAFLLAGPPYRYGEAAIGLLGLIGVAGALVARGTTVVSRRGHQGPATGVLLAVGALSFVATAAGRTHLAALLLGTSLLDITIRSTQQLNMNVVYGLVDHARSRVATVYMTCYTLGGVAGSAAGTEAYRLGGWNAVCAVGAGCMTLGLAVWIRDLRVAAISEDGTLDRVAAVTREVA